MTMMDLRPEQLLEVKPEFIERIVPNLQNTPKKQSPFGLWDDAQYFTTIFISAIISKWSSKRFRLRMERWATFQPTTVSALEKLTVPYLKEALQEVYFHTCDKERLHGWYLPAQRGKLTVVLARCNYGNMRDKEAIIQAFQKAGFGVFLFDYRGYGKSTGRATEEGAFLDFLSASDYVADQLGVPYDQQIAMGESLGGAVAVDGALKRPFRALVLCATFTRIVEVYQNLKSKFSLLKWVLVPDNLLQQTFNTISKINQIAMPLLLFQGDQDFMIPLSMSYRLLASATRAPFRKLCVIQGGNHDNLFYIAPREIVSVIEAMLSV